MSALRLDLSNLELSIRARASRGRAAPPRAAALAGSAVSVRLRVIALASAGLLLCLGALASAALGLDTLLGPDFQFTMTQRAVLALGLGAAAALFSLGLWRFERRTWANTARLIDALPRLRAPLLAALVVYALGSFAIRFGDDLVAHLSWNSSLGRAPPVAWPGWSALLSMAALSAAAGVAIHQSWWGPMRPLQRWVWASAFATSAALAAFALTRWGSWGSGAGSLGSALGAASSSVSFSSLAGSGVPDAGIWTADAALSPDTRDSGPRPELRDAAPAEDEASVELPKPTAVAVSPTIGTALVGQDDPESLKAVALTQARRPAGMLDAVRSLARLLAVSPDQANDPDVRRILSKAASAEGEASRAAFSVMSEAMGSRGPDLLYELMLQKPALYERAKFRLSRFRVRKLFSPELTIAFDLRFTTSCGSRLGLLPRANEVGDQRSINALSSLVSKPKNCGRRDTGPCYVSCPREAEPFNRSIETIARRIRGGAKDELPAPLARQAPTD